MLQYSILCCSVCYAGAKLTTAGISDQSGNLSSLKRPIEASSRVAINKSLVAGHRHVAGVLGLRILNSTSYSPTLIFSSFFEAQCCDDVQKRFVYPNFIAALEIRLVMPPAVETWRGESAMEMVDDSETGIPVKLPNAREVLIAYILDSKILPGKGKWKEFIMNETTETYFWCAILLTWTCQFHMSGKLLALFSAGVRVACNIKNGRAFLGC